MSDPTLSDYIQCYNSIKKYIFNYNLILKYLKYKTKLIDIKYPNCSYLPYRLIYIINRLPLKRKYFIATSPYNDIFVGDTTEYDTFERLLNPKYQSQIINLLINKAAGISTFIDIGANTATISIRLSKIYNDNIKIYSFEPIPNTYKLAASNIVLNNISNISLYNLGIGDCESKIIFHTFKGQSSCATAISNRTPHDKNCKMNSLTVNCTTLDSFVYKNNISRVDLMKIDVEGYELNVLKGAINVINKDGPTFLYEYNECAVAAGWTYKNVEDIIASSGRKYKYSVLQHNGELTVYPPREGASVDILAECIE